MENIKIQNALDLCVIDIEGTIGVPEEWQFEDPQQRVATYEKFRTTVARIEELEAQQVVVNIRSTGGDVNDALLIYEALASLSAQIVTRCYGYVASAATVIAQAASAGQRFISANSLYLIHNSSCSAEGNAEELTAKVELLRKTDEQLSALYARHGSKTQEEYALLMASDAGKGTWLSALETIEAGLADSVIETSIAEVEQTQEQEQENTQQGDETQGDGVSAIFKRISKRLGLSAKEEPQSVGLPQCGHNVLHTPQKSQQDALSVIELQEGQRAVRASRISQREDASLSEATLSANEMAYKADAQRIIR